MNREEAIKLLNDIHSQCCDTANILCTPDADKRCEALQMAITALQNQPICYAPMTNADRIRSMTDQELAEFIINLDNRFGEEYEGEQSCLSWLQRESEE